MKAVNHVLAQLQVEQVLGCRAGELLEGGGEEEEPVVESQGGLTFSASLDQLGQAGGGGEMEPLTTGVNHQTEAMPVRSETEVSLRCLSKLLDTCGSRFQPHFQLVPGEKNKEDRGASTAP